METPVTTVRARREPGAMRMELPADTVLAVLIRRDPNGYLLAKYEAAPPPGWVNDWAGAPILVSRAPGTLREVTIQALKWLLERL